MTHPYVKTLVHFIRKNNLKEANTQQIIRTMLEQIKLTNAAQEACNQQLVEAIKRVNCETPLVLMEKIHPERALIAALGEEDCTPDIVRIFCESGVNLEYQSEYETGILSRQSGAVRPLVAATLHNRLDLVIALIDHGAKVDGRDFTTPLCIQKTALMIAARESHKDIVAYLIKAGADVTATSRMKSNTPYQSVTARELARDYDIITMLENAENKKQTQPTSFSSSSFTHFKPNAPEVKSDDTTPPPAPAAPSAVSAHTIRPGG